MVNTLGINWSHLCITQMLSLMKGKWRLLVVDEVFKMYQMVQCSNSIGRKHRLAGKRFFYMLSLCCARHFMLPSPVLNTFVRWFVRPLVLPLLSISLLEWERVSGDDNKRVFPVNRIYRVNTNSWISTVPQGSEQSEWVSERSKRSKAERGGVSKRNERCEQTNVANDRVARSRRDCLK